MKYVFNLVWNLLLKYALEVQDINRTIKFITVLYSDQPFPSITIGVKDFGIVIAQSSHTDFLHFLFHVCWPVYRIHITLFE